MSFGVVLGGVMFGACGGVSAPGAEGEQQSAAEPATVEQTSSELGTLIACGGFLNRRCPTGFSCVDDPRDECSPCRGGADCPGICVELTCKAKCDPTLVCGQVVTCVDGFLYPTNCGPRNCDAPIGPCATTNPK
jgi:hypothetical protein